MNLKNSQYQAIMRQYDLRQLQHRHLQSQALSGDLRSSACLPAAGRRNRLFLCRQSQGSCLGRKDVLQDMQQHLQELQDQKTLLLTQAGYPADYLELTYSCPDCHDTGFIGDKKCHCFKQAMVDLLYRQSNIHDVLKRENFDTFDIRYYSDTKNRSLASVPARISRPFSVPVTISLIISMSSPGIFSFTVTPAWARLF